jgi:23S rRNA maturation mini-RNase III
MTEPYIVTGSYVVQREHALQDSPLDRALELMEGAALRFSLDAISDEKIRASYLRNIKRMSLQTIEDVKAGKITAQEGVAFSHEMRNKILTEHRKLTSAQGLAVVQKKKQDGRTLKWLLDRYSNDLFKKSYETLSAAEQQKVHYTILEAAGRDDAKFTKGTKKMVIMGKLGVLVTAALATYQILEADNKPKEAARQGIIVGGGAAGGILAGAGVIALCGPGAPLCAIAVVLVGSVVGGAAGGLVADSLDEELEEFSHWDIF